VPETKRWALGAGRWALGAGRRGAECWALGGIYSRMGQLIN